MTRLRRTLSCCGAWLVLMQFAPASEGREAALRKEAQFQLSSDAARNASLKAAITSGRAIQTGPGAQMELHLDNGVLVRLGQNSQFALRKGGDELDLLRGAMLVRAPKSAGPTLVATGNVVSDVSGTTSLLEQYPQAYIKLISLDGTARMFMPNVVGESVLVKAGQLLMFHTRPEPKGLPNPVDVDINRLMATSLLIKGFAPLGTESSIAQEMQAQKRQKSDGALTETNLVIFGRGTLVSLVPPEAEQKGRKATASSTPHAH